MRARGLTGRIIASFLALTVLATALLAGGLFAILRDLHQSQAEARIAGLLPALAVATRDPRVINEQTLLADLRDLVPSDVTLAVITGAGDIILLGDSNAPTSAVPLPADPVTGPGNRPAGPITTGTIDTGNGRFTYGAMSLAAASRAAPAAQISGHLVVLEPDTSAAAAAADLVRVTILMFLLVALAALPLALYLARSIVRPLQRLALATKAVPRDASVRVPESGPSEVRELTAHFNAMTAEIGRARDREAELLVNLRHDLRTPLTVIGGFAEAIRDGVVTGSDAVAAATTITTETDRLADLVAQLGDTGLAVVPLHPEPTDVGAVLAANRERFMARAAVAEVEVSLEPFHVPAILVDPTAIDRILGNLLDNALAATSAGGHVWLGARAVPHDGHPGVTITVIDDGPGFPPDELPRAFDRFWRAGPSRTGDGAGLGLAIVRELARAHGGEAWADNAAPRGALVRVWLPAAT